MYKTKFTITQLIINVINAVLLFVPGFFIRELYTKNSYSPGYSLSFSDSISYSGITLGGDFSADFVVQALLAISTIVLCIMFITYQKPVGKILIVNYVLSAVCLFVFYFRLTNIPIISNSHFSYTASYFYYIYVVLTVVNLVLAVVSEFVQFKPKEKVPVQINNGISYADELGKYKELLDKGVITQEEFEAKKRQILGIQ